MAGTSHRDRLCLPPTAWHSIWAWGKAPGFCANPCVSAESAAQLSAAGKTWLNRAFSAWPHLALNSWGVAPGF